MSYKFQIVIPSTLIQKPQKRENRSGEEVKVGVSIVIATEIMGRVGGLSRRRLILKGKSVH